MKILFKFLGAFLLLCIAVLSCLPLFFSTSVGKNMLAGIISKRSEFKVEVETLKLSWFGTQSAQGIKARRERDQIVITCKEASTDASLWVLLTKYPMSGHVVIVDGNVDLHPVGLDPVAFEQISASLERNREELTIDLNCGTRHNQVAGQIALKLAATELKSAFPNLSVLATATHLPVLGIDQLVSIFSPDLKGVIYEAVGETVDMQCHLTAAQGNLDVNLNAESPQAGVQIATKTEGGIISLKTPAAIHFNLSPALFQKFANLALLQPATIEGTLSQFSCPVPSRASDLLKASFQAKVTSPSPWNLNNFSLSNLNLTAKSASLEKEMAIDFGANIEMQKQTCPITMSGTIAAPFSKTPTGSFSVSLSKFPTDLIGMSSLLGPSADFKGNLELTGAESKLGLSWQSQFLNIPSLNLSLGNSITLISPAPFTYLLDPQIASADPAQGTLQNLAIPMDNMRDVTLDAVIRADRIAFAGDFPLNISKAEATLNIKASHLKGKLISPSMTLGSITLRNTAVPFEADSKAASIQLSSDVQNGSMQGQFNLTTAKEMDFSGSEISGMLDIQNLSSTLLDAALGKPIVSAVAGPLFSAKLKILSTPDKQNVAVKWSSPNLNADAAFAIKNGALQLQGASNQISWILTPESYQALDKLITGPNNAMVPFEISEPSTFSISLTKLNLPVTLKGRIPEIAFDLEKLSLNSTGSNAKLSFLNKSSKETIQLSNLLFAVNKSGIGEPLTASLESVVVTQGGQQSVKNGSFSLSAKLENNDLSQLTGSFQLKVQQFPSRALDLIARAQGRTDFPFSIIFGDMINAKASAELKNFSGPISVNIHTLGTQLDLDGHLTGGALLLNSPFYAQMKITPEISRLFLKEVNPLNLSYFYSGGPVTLEIHPDGFYFPLYPFSLPKIAIPEAVIELGKIACRNEGNVNTTLGLLKSHQFDKSGELALWFAPIDLGIKQGIADIDRTEILIADTFDVCLWGNVDLVKDYVDMILGLTSQTLAKAFGIKNLPENYVLTLPMKGPSNNVQINTGKATAKIALLLAWQNANAAGAFGNGPAGAIVGGLLNKVATLPDSNAKVPPAKHPFPWEVGTPSKTSHARKHRFKAQDKPLKQILKVIR